MAVNMEEMIGQLYEDDNGHKIMILAHDFCTDNLLAYDLIDQKEVFVTRQAVDDNMLNPWQDVVKSEIDLMVRMRERLEMKIWDACVDGRTVEDGFITYRHDVKRLDPDNDGGEVTLISYPYEEAKLSKTELRVGMSALETFATASALSFKQILDEAKIDHIIWRTHPQIGLHHDMRGRRYLYLRMRFACLSDGQQIKMMGRVPNA